MKTKKLTLHMGMEVEVEKYRGYWAVIDEEIVHGEPWVLLEHTIYGDETCYLVCRKTVLVNETNKIIDNVFETYYDIIQCLIDEFEI